MRLDTVLPQTAGSCKRWRPHSGGPASRLAVGLALLMIFLVLPADTPQAQGRHAQSLYEGLGGLLLVASPSMSDPRFSGTVIYLMGHNDRGALGMIINRPAVEVPLADLFRVLKLDAPGVTETVEIRAGGPVEPDVGFILHSPDVSVPETQRIDDRLAISSWRKLLPAMAKGERPRQIVFTLGAANWGPGQLEREMIQGAWFSAPAEADIIFLAEPEEMWSILQSSRGVDL